MDADLNALERTLIQTLRAAGILYEDGCEEAAMEVVHREAIPMVAACVRHYESFEFFEAAEGPILGGSHDA